MHTLRRIRLSLITLTLAVCVHLSPAQQRAPIADYIHHSWDQLQRSTTDCTSLVDPKVAAVPVLYLAANEHTPKAVTAMQKQCKVDVRRLPRPITHEGEVLPGDLPASGLLYLPNRYVVPGGRFNEMYGWDSYFILLGELADNRLDLARGTVENFFYEIDFYGSILNANRTYYLTRSQPPFLSSMVLAVYHAQEAKDPKAAKKWLKKALPYLERDHALWTTAPHLAGDTGLSRYVDLGSGPVPEMADSSSYYVDVIQWLKAHPAQTPVGYLQKAATTQTCADTAPCPHTTYAGLTLTDAFFHGDRAMRESGFDTSFRFGPFSGGTDHFAPFCLNALLYKYERDMAFVAATLGQPDKAVAWSSAAGARLAKINELMWDDATGFFYDYNLHSNTRSTYRYLTAYYALWTGIATPAQAQRLVAALPQFEREGGLQTSTTVTGEQWDAPFGWAPLNWLAVEGLESYGFDADARRIAKKFTATVDTNYTHDGTIREKYNVVTQSANIAVNAGYKENVIGFGWTNGVYTKMQELLATPQKPQERKPSS